MPQLLHSGKQLMSAVYKKSSRKMLRTALLFASEERKIRAERWLRGRDQVRRLGRADAVIVSYGKSGRTWLRVMLSRFYQVKHSLPQHYIMGFDNYHAMDRAIPKIFFTHDNYIKDYTGNHDSKRDFYDCKVVMMARDPRDVAVSQFFQWKYRMKSSKVVLLKFPVEGSDVPIFDFVMDPTVGLPNIISFMNLWAEEQSRMKDFMLLRYEDLRVRPEAVLRELLEFLDTPGTDAQIHEAVEFSSYENMKKMEQKKTFWLSGGRMVPRDRDNPDSYKVRRAKVGGYRDYFDDDQVAQIQALVDSTLSPYFGYNSESRGKGAERSTPDTQATTGSQT